MGEFRKSYRGNWAGFSSRTVAALMNCSLPTSQQYLRELARRLGGYWLITPADIGRLVHNYLEFRDYLLLNPGWRPSIGQRMALILPNGMTHSWQHEPELWTSPNQRLEQ